MAFQSTVSFDVAIKGILACGEIIGVQSTLVETSASQLGTTVTGTGFISAMYGAAILFADNTTTVVVNFVNSTTLTVVTTATKPLQEVKILYGGTQIDGNALFSNTLITNNFFAIDIFCTNITVFNNATIDNDLFVTNIANIGVVIAGSVTSNSFVDSVTANITGLLTAGSANITGALTANSITSTTFVNAATANITGLLTAGSGEITTGDLTIDAGNLIVTSGNITTTAGSVSAVKVVISGLLAADGNVSMSALINHPGQIISFNSSTMLLEATPAPTFSGQIPTANLSIQPGLQWGLMKVISTSPTPSGFGTGTLVLTAYIVDNCVIAQIAGTVQFQVTAIISVSFTEVFPGTSTLAPLTSQEVGININGPSGGGETYRFQVGKDISGNLSWGASPTAYTGSFPGNFAITGPLTATFYVYSMSWVRQ